MEDQTLTLGGKKFVVPPLSARRCIKFAKIVSGFGAINPTSMSEEQMTSVYEALLVGLQQDKPTMTIDELLDLPVTMENAFEAIKVVSKQAGLELERSPPQPAANAASASPTPSAYNGTGIA